MIVMSSPWMHDQLIYTGLLPDPGQVIVENFLFSYFFFLFFVFFSPSLFLLVQCGIKKAVRSKLQTGLLNNTTLTTKYGDGGGG